MRIGIISDVHDAVPTLRAALTALQDVDTLLVAGDLCSPFVLPVLAHGYRRGRIHVVFGNNDGDRFRMAVVAQAFDHLELHGEVYQAVVGGRALAMNHFPALAYAMDAEHIPIIVYGHDHRFRVERTEHGWLLNPGTLLGYDPVADAEVPATFLVLDVDRDEVEGYRMAGLGAGRDLRVEPHPA